MKPTGSRYDLLVGHLVQHGEETINKFVVKKGGIAREITKVSTVFVSEKDEQ